MLPKLDLEPYGLSVEDVRRNLPPARLYEYALTSQSAAIVASGALAIRSGAKTGRSPKDKRIADHAASRGDVWWGDVNIPLGEHSFLINRQRARDYLNTCKRLYVCDGFAGADPRHRLKIRVVCESPYHALFMHNMLLRPTREELLDFGEPDFLILNAGHFPANPLTNQVGSGTSIALSFEQRELVILGTEYAGEMKKGVFTIMNYILPKAGVLSMHCSANEGPPRPDGSPGDVTLFFGLSGTGKTTLSADPRRRLIGDDEHGWSDDGVFNIEGGCYAKAIGLTPEREPEIWKAIRFGTVLENVVYDQTSREVDFADARITENTRAAYPLEYIDNAKLPSVGGHPRNAIFLTCDAFGVLPPVSRLTPEQAMYHFLSGYTAKVAGTEMGVSEPTATFSACFGAAFLVWRPTKYAEMLAEKLRTTGARAWLVNTGWTGGGYGVGRRIDLGATRAIIDAIHAGALDDAPATNDPVFGVAVPTECPGVPSELLAPRGCWTDPAAYDFAARKLAGLFDQNFRLYAADASDAIRAAGPRVG